MSGRLTVKLVGENHCPDLLGHARTPESHQNASQAKIRFDPTGIVPVNLENLTRLKSLEDAFFAEWQITAQQYNVLRILQANGAPMPTLAIANKLISRAPDITRMLDRLEKQNWIVRVRSDADRRSVLVEITETGLHLLDSMADGVNGAA